MPTPNGEKSAKRRGVFAFALLLVVGALAFLPGLRTPFLLDDYMHTSMTEGTFCAKRGPFDLYDFVNDGDRATYLQRGLLPWWSHPKLTIRFFRPLSSALRWGEQRAFGTQPLLFHLHSLAWWIVAVLGARALFRRAFSPRVTLLATVIFALGQWHVLPIAWLANREVLISLAFGSFALAAYARWRESRGAKDAIVAALLFGISMLAGEYALCFGGYVVAIELVRRDGIVQRALGLLPFAIPAGIYLAVRGALGYGTYGSAFYLDPLREPLGYLRVAPVRLVTLLGEAWLTLGSSAWGTTAPKWLIAALVIVGIALSFIPLRRALAALEDGPRKTATWLLLGSFLALTPVLAVVPAPRLLGVSALGMALIVAVILDHAWFPPPGAPARRQLLGFVATILGFAHLVHGPVSSFIASRELRGSSLAFAESAALLRAHVPDAVEREVVVVRGTAGMFFGPFALDPRGVQAARWRILAHGGHVLALRKDARTIDLVAPADQGVFPVGPGNLFRSEDATYRAGDETRVSGMQVSIIAVEARGPRHVRFTFDKDLDDPSLLWIDEGIVGLRRIDIPATGFGAPFDP